MWELYGPTCFNELYLHFYTFISYQQFFFLVEYFVSPILPVQPNNFVIVLKSWACLFSGDFLSDFPELLCSLLTGMLFWRFIGEDYSNPRDQGFKEGTIFPCFYSIHAASSSNVGSRTCMFELTHSACIYMLTKNWFLRTNVSNITLLDQLFVIVMGGRQSLQIS